MGKKRDKVLSDLKTVQMVSLASKVLVVFHVSTVNQNPWYDLKYSWLAIQS